jgi:hypothetical protein
MRVLIAVCLLGACGVERTEAVELNDGAMSDTGGVTGDDVGSDVPGEIDGGAADGPSSWDVTRTGSLDCTDPLFVTSSPSGIWTDAGSGYLVFNNMWNLDAGPGPETIYACSYHSWYVVSDQMEGSGAVKTYPNVQRNYKSLPIPSLQSVISTFAETSPRVGVYEYAYDVWLNGIATASSTQIMIWVDNYNRVPSGSRVTTTTLGGRTYDVWRTVDGFWVGLVSTANFTSGTLDLLEIFNWTIAQGWLPSNSTLDQIDFGVEIVSTGAASATYVFSDFSISTN